LSCSCHRNVEDSLVAVRSRILAGKNRMISQLEKFKENIKNGFHQLAANHLFKAGAYFASADNGLDRNPPTRDILASLRRRLRGRGGRLLVFFERNTELVEKQAYLVDVEGLLRGILRQGEKAVGLLEGNGERELQEAERVLERLEKMESYLASWREAGVGSADYVKIVDMHDGDLRIAR
jgi:hypothetical protein